MTSNPYRIPPGTGPGPLPNRQRLGIDLLNMLSLRYGEEGVHDRTGIVAIEGKEVGFVVQEGLGELMDRFGDAGRDLFVEDPPAGGEHGSVAVASGGGGGGCAAGGFSFSSVDQLSGRTGAGRRELSGRRRGSKIAAAPAVDVVAIRGKHEQGTGHGQGDGGEQLPSSSATATATVCADTATGGGGSICLLLLLLLMMMALMMTPAALLGREPHGRHSGRRRRRRRRRCHY